MRFVGRGPQGLENEMTGQHQTRKLPDVVYVSLAEALTWIAFRDAMSPEELRSHVEGIRTSDTKSDDERLAQFFGGQEDDAADIPGSAYFADRERGLQRLSDAWATLRQTVAHENIKVRGRFSAGYSLAGASLADTVQLTADVLATFSQFDVSTGGIRRQPNGSPHVLWRDHQGFGREFGSFGSDERAADGFFFVEVQRAGLVNNVSLAQKMRAASVKTGRPPPDDEILARADAMKLRGTDGRTIAKTMRLEPGFENVATTQVRELIRGRWKAGPPRKGT